MIDARGIKVGDRVYHRSQQWPGAYWGTATVVQRLEKETGSGPSTEYRVQVERWRDLAEVRGRELDRMRAEAQHVEG